MAYFPVTGKTVMFGGSGNGVLSDTWLWDGSSWTPQTTANTPPARWGATLAYDSTTGTLILFGGNNGTSSLGDTWSYDGTNWTQLSPAASPSARFSQGMAYDAAIGSVVLFSGNITTVGDTYTYTGGSFTAPATPVGTAAAQTSVYFTIGTAGTLPALSNSNVLTTGSSGLDFTLGTGSTCSGTVSAGETCTVNVAFTPAAAGKRLGAVQLLNSGGTVLATAYISGTGTAPVAAFQSGVASTVLSSLNQPSRVIFDAAGNVYVADPANRTVKKYAPGSSSGTSVGSSYSGPNDLAIDGAGTLFVADTDAGHIVTVTAAGVQSTLGTGSVKASGLVVDGAGFVYEVESCNASPCPVKKLLGTSGAGGTWTTIGTYAAQQPGHMALDSSGNLIISAQSAIYKLASSSNGSVASAVTFSGYTPSTLSGIAIDPAGNTFLADSGSNSLYEAPASGSTAILLASGSMFSDVTWQAGNLFYTDLTNKRVGELTRSTTSTLAYPSTPDGSTSSMTVSLENDGNAALNFSVPSSGSNPAITGSYGLSSSSTCPQVSSTGSVQSLASGLVCTDIAQFQPTAIAASNPGTLTISDNSNNVASTQSFNMSGSSTQGSQTITFPAPTSPAGIGTSTTLTATASSGLPITYTIGAGSTGTATISGSTITYTSPGTVIIVASQAGNANYTVASNVSQAVTVQLNPTTLTLSSSLNPAAVSASVMLTATLSASSLSGELITFMNGGTTLGTGTLSNGVATYTTTALPAGLDILTAVYSGDSSYAGSTSNSVSEAVGGLPSFVVTSNLDDGTGSCTDQAVSGATLDANCQLRVAISTGAIPGSGQPIITFAPALSGQSITLQSGITSSYGVAINGPGMSNVTIAGPNTSTTLLTFTGANTNVNVSGIAFRTGATAVTASGSNMNLTVGSASFTAFVLPAVYANSLGTGVLTVTNSTFTNNVGTSANGQGIAANATSLMLTGSTFTGNTQVGGTGRAVGGGAVSAYGSAPSGSYVTIDHCYFSGNHAAVTANNGGGAVYINQSNSTVVISNSTFATNVFYGTSTGTTQHSHGGALYVVASLALTISNSTFQANKVLDAIDATGGAIYARSSSAINLYNDTITGNAVRGYGDNAIPQGSTNISGNGLSYAGGVDLGSSEYPASYIANFYNTYVGGNGSDTYPDSTNCFVNPGGGAGCNLVSSVVGVNQTGTSAYSYSFSALGYYPSTASTRVLLPAPGSPLIGAGSTANLGGATVDQRGQPRTLNSKVDIGAVETNYSLAFVQQPSSTVVGATMSPAPQVQLLESGSAVPVSGASITLTPASGVLSGTEPELTSTTGISTYSDLSVSSIQAGDTLTATLPLTAGSSPATATTTSTSFAVTGKSQTITFPNPGTQTFGTSPSMTATSTSGLTVAFTSTTPAVCAVTTGGAVTFVAAGSCTIAADQAGNSTYAAAAEVTQTFAVTPVVPSAPVIGTATAGAQQATVRFTAPASTGGSAITQYTVTSNSGNITAVGTGSPITVTGLTAGVSYTFTVTATNTAGTGASSAASNAVTPLGTYIWLVNANGTLAELNSSGANVNSGAVGTSGQTSAFGGAAFDGAGHLFSVSSTNNVLDEITTSSLSAQTTAVTGLNAPVAVAVDGNNNVWIANSGNGTVSVIGPSVTNASGLNYGSTYPPGIAMNAPSAIAIDNAGGVWVANKAGNSVTHIIGAAVPVTAPLAAATAAGTQGVEP